MTLDDVRAARPYMGFAVYAYTPGGPVTIEVHAPGGEIFSATGPTEAAALSSLFPDLEINNAEPERDVFG